MASASLILVLEVVSGDTVVALWLKSIAPTCSFLLRWATNACSAAVAAASGLPVVLKLVSRTSTTPNVFGEAWLAGVTVRSTTGPPFSVTWTP